MKNSKAARKPKTPDKILECAGNAIGGDCWLKIGLSRKELALVTRLAKDYKFKRSPSAAMARQLVMMALVNLPVIERSWNAVIKYCEAEKVYVPNYLEARARKVLDSLYDDENEGEAWKNG
jgi:hypothetical protein